MHFLNTALCHQVTRTLRDEWKQAKHNSAGKTLEHNGDLPTEVAGEVIGAN